MSKLLSKSEVLFFCHVRRKKTVKLVVKLSSTSGGQFVGTGAHGSQSPIRGVGTVQLGTLK